MPKSKLLFFQDTPGHSPVVEWLRALRSENPRAYAKCAVRIRRLAEVGHELRRPEADFLQHGIFELRARLGRVNHRVPYFSMFGTRPFSATG